MAHCYCMKYQLLCYDVKQYICKDRLSGRCQPIACPHHFDRELNEEEENKMHESAGRI